MLGGAGANLNSGGVRLDPDSVQHGPASTDAASLSTGPDPAAWMRAGPNMA